MDYRLDSLAILISQHYRLLKSIVTSDHSIPTEEEAILADRLADIIEQSGGKRIADYCRIKFTRGYLSGDLRSYKIKLALIYFRDILKPGKVKDELSERLDEIVDMSESLAGCKADGKRRNKKAVEERMKKREEKKALKEERLKHIPKQMELFNTESSKASKDATVESSESSDEEMDLDITYVPLKSAKKRRSYGGLYNTSAKSDRYTKKSAFERMTDALIRKEYGARNDYDNDEEDGEDGEYENYGDENEENYIDENDGYSDTDNSVEEMNVIKDIIY